jgi:hypothetical protein
MFKNVALQSKSSVKRSIRRIVSFQDFDPMLPNDREVNLLSASLHESTIFSTLDDPMLLCRGCEMKVVPVVASRVDTQKRLRVSISTLK